jgi:hypothetical protein
MDLIILLHHIKTAIIREYYNTVLSYHIIPHIYVFYSLIELQNVNQIVLGIEVWKGLK